MASRRGCPRDPHHPCLFSRAHGTQHITNAANVAFFTLNSHHPQLVQVLPWRSIPNQVASRLSTRSRSKSRILVMVSARFPLLFPPCVLTSFGGCFKQPGSITILRMISKRGNIAAQRCCSAHDGVQVPIFGVWLVWYARLILVLLAFSPLLTILFPAI